MSAPAWLAGSFAVLMVVIAACCAARLAISRLRGKNTEPDADTLHVLMGVAMAGMLEPRLDAGPRHRLACGVRGRGRVVRLAGHPPRPPRRGGTRHAPGGPRRRMRRHDLHAAARRLLALRPPPRDGDARHEPGHHHRQPRAHPGAGAFHARLRPVGHRPARPPGPDPGSRNRPRTYRRPLAPGRSDHAGHPGRGRARRHRLSPHTAASPVLAPRLAASYKIAMAITMGYMLITML